MSYTTATARSALRRAIQDGQTSDATPVAFNYARLEDISDQIPAVATPTQTTFMVRFQTVPTEEYITVFVVPGTLRAYVDGASVPVVPSADADVNGNFTLPSAPVSGLQVTYAWQYLADSDIDSYVDTARAWLAYSDLSLVPDGLCPALVDYAASQALIALSRKATLANARAGDTEMAFSTIAEMWAKLAEDELKAAIEARDDFYAGSGKNVSPAVASVGLAIGSYQPPR